MSKVILRCLKKGCPRIVKLDFDAESMPAGTVEIKSYCDWHQEIGSRGYNEKYFDANRKELRF